MIRRFSLYGFLKNQQYFEPFLILAFLDKGLSFSQIGILIGFLAICVNLMEVPTGAVADVAGRRRSMMLSFFAYIVAFITLAFADSFLYLLPGMFLFSIGEAFRTGTHKAIIFAWLAHEGRADEKTKVYGFTRSWSKMGSALSAVIAPILVIAFRDYSIVFLAPIPAYIGNIINFATYPKWLDGETDEHHGVRQMAATLWRSLREAVSSRDLRRLFVESMGFEGVFKVSKDYIQPVAATMAVGAAAMIPLFAEMGDELQRKALVVGVVYCVLYLISSYASRHAHSVVKLTGSEPKAAKLLWVLDFVTFGLLTAGVLLNWSAVVIAAFVVLAILQNFWRPVLVSRFADLSNPERTATILSVESQGKTLFAAVAAPLLGLAVDAMIGWHEPWRFLPVGLLGLVVAGGILLTQRKAARPADSEDASDRREHT
ncbi:MAG: MFS transporter [Phycisphaerae bacterium]